MSKVLVQVNKLLADHGEPPVEKYSSWDLKIRAIKRRKDNPDDTLRDHLDNISQMAEPYDWYRKQARELEDREDNTTTSYCGTLYTCELRLKPL